MIVADNLPDPADDADVGYGNPELTVTLPAAVDLNKVKGAVKQLVEQSQRRQQQAGPDDLFGEVAAPDGGYPAPEEFFGPAEDDDEDDEDYEDDEDDDDDNYFGDSFIGP